MLTNVERYWEQYLASIPADAQRPSDHAGTAAFGITWDDAREIAALVLNGTKTECKRIGREPTVKAPLAMERFRVIYSEPMRLP